MNSLRPSKWKNCRFSDVVNIEYGKSPKEIFHDQGEYPVIGTGGVTGFTNSYLHEGETTVIGRKGTINNPSFIASRFWPIDTTYYVSKHLNAEAKWFYYFVQNTDLTQFNEASGVPSLNRDTLYAIPCLLPPPQEQRKIAAILTAADDAIESTQAQISKLKDLKTGMMQELLTKGIGHTEFKDSPVGRIPGSWNVLSLGEVTSDSAFGPRFSSDAYHPKGNIGCVRTTDIDQYWDIDYSTVPLAALDLEEFRSHLLEDGDLLITRSGTCGVVDVFRKQPIPMVAAAFLIRFRLTAEVNPHYLRYAMMSQGVQRDIQLLASGGVQKNLSGSNLKTLLLPIPNLDEQRRIVASIDSIGARISATLEKQRNIQLLKKALMQDLLTGKVRVNVN